MVNVINDSLQNFIDMSKNRRVFLFGLSKSLKKRKMLRTPNDDIFEHIYKIVDNDDELIGTQYIANDRKINIISVNHLKNEISKNDIILISSIYGYGEIINQLDESEEFNNIDCYVLCLIDDYADGKVDTKLWKKLMESEEKIPKIIHYCWFGGKALPKEYATYIESWKKYCPDYEIIKWDESNYDISKNSYLRWASNSGKWAFVSDYARLDIIYNHGGVYLDTDVELIKNIDDILKLPAFIGFESTQMLNSGLGIGSYKGNEMIKKFIEEYDLYSVNEHDDFDFIPCTVHQTNVLRQNGIILNNSLQINMDKTIVTLPTDFLCGMRLNTRVTQIKERTCAIHHYAGNWGGEKSVERGKRARFDNAWVLERVYPSLENVK